MRNNKSMKAAVYYRIEDLRVEEMEIPEIGEGDILLRVGACAICGTDVKVYKYGYKTLEPPAIIGHEISGTIVDRGKKVKGYEIGERVSAVPIVSKLSGTLRVFKGYNQEGSEGRVLHRDRYVRAPCPPGRMLHARGCAFGNTQRCGADILHKRAHRGGVSRRDTDIAGLLLQTQVRSVRRVWVRPHHRAHHAVDKVA